MIVDIGEKVIKLKVLYYGPPESGKSTNLLYINEKFKGKNLGLKELETAGQKHLSLILAPPGLEKLRSFTVWTELNTVPSNPEYKTARRILLRNVDAVVFVADSKIERTNENFQMIVDLKDNLTAYGLETSDIFILMQYNKRDLPDAAPIPYLQRVLNGSLKAPYTEAIAIQGVGVIESLNMVFEKLIESLKTKYGS